MQVAYNQEIMLLWDLHTSWDEIISIQCHAFVPTDLPWCLPFDCKESLIIDATPIIDFITPCGFRLKI